MSTPRRAICIRWRSTSGSASPTRGALGVDTVYVGKYFLDAANTATYPGHTVANARIAWSPAKTWRTTLRVDNLFDTRYADRADFAFGNYRYFPARGRAVFLSVDYARN